jgi:hypothetical protein
LRRVQEAAASGAELLELLFDSLFFAGLVSADSLLGVSLLSESLRPSEIAELLPLLSVMYQPDPLKTTGGA